MFFFFLKDIGRRFPIELARTRANTVMLINRCTEITKPVLMVIKSDGCGMTQLSRMSFDSSNRWEKGSFLGREGEGGE